LGDLERRLQAIGACLDDDVQEQDPFGDLCAGPAANANSPAVQEPETLEGAVVLAEIEAVAPPAPAKIESPLSFAGSEDVAPAGATFFTATLPHAADFDCDRNELLASSDPADTQASPRLSHLLMVAELDRLLDARAVAGMTADKEPVFEAPADEGEPANVALEAPASAPVDAARPVEAVDPAETAASGPAPLVPPTPSPPPYNSTGESAKVDIAMDPLADVMALSDEERIALFT